MTLLELWLINYSSINTEQLEADARERRSVLRYTYRSHFA